MFDRTYTRIDTIRKWVDEMLNSLEDPEVRRNGFVHLYGVGQASALVSLHRGHDRSYAELGEIAGMLHDYAKYKYDVEDNHGPLSSKEADTILKATKEFTEKEISTICHAIKVHSNKAEVDSEFDEILKDADEMQHYLRNPMEDYYFNRERINKLMSEFKLKEKDNE